MNSNGNHPIYRIITLKGLPGLFYERMQTIKYISSYKELIFRLDLLDLENTIRELFYMIPTSEPCESNPSICGQEQALESRLRRTIEALNHSVLKIKSNETITQNISNTVYIPSRFEEIKHRLDVDVTNLHTQIDLNSTVSNYSQWLKLAEICVTRIEDTVGAFNNIIELLRSGKISENLISTDHLEELIKKQDKYYFQIKENYERLIKTNYDYIQGKLILSMSIPLLDSKNYTLYKLYKLPIFQSSCFTSIKTENQYIAFEKNNKIYTLPKDHELVNCFDFGKLLICPADSKFYMGNSCEKNLFNIDNEGKSNICKFETTDYKEDYWQQMSYSKGWLFSLKEDIDMNIYCTNKTNFSTKISGIGILLLSQSCRVEIRSWMLFGIKHQELSYIYKTQKTNVHCNLINNKNYLILPMLILSILVITVLFFLIYQLSKSTKTRTREISTNTQVLFTRDSSVQINFCMDNYDIPKPPKYIYDFPSKGLKN